MCIVQVKVKVEQVSVLTEEFYQQCFSLRSKGLGNTQYKKCDHITKAWQSAITEFLLMRNAGELKVDWSD